MNKDSNLEKYKQDIDKLFKKGLELLHDLYDEKSNKKKSQKADNGKQNVEPGMKFRASYENWYSESLEVIRQLLPNRLEDFRHLYKQEKRKDITYESYTIADYLIGLVITRLGEPIFNTHIATFTKFQQQILILESTKRRFESSLLDIKRLVQADLFDSELDSAKELFKNGFLRAAGNVAGVVIEKHLRQVCQDHNIKITKKHPTINDYNELLRTNSVIEIPVWRSIQHLGDLRNICDHDRKREPREEEVQDLIDGVKKIMKTVN